MFTRCRILTSAEYLQQAVFRELLDFLPGCGNDRVECKSAVPLCHPVSHNFKEISNDHEVRALFKIGFKLTRFTPFSKSKLECGKEHRFLNSVTFANSVVYGIPLKCGFIYIGMTVAITSSGNCVNKSSISGKMSFRRRCCAPT